MNCEMKIWNAFQIWSDLVASFRYSCSARSCDARSHPVRSALEMNALQHRQDETGSVQNIHPTNNSPNISPSRGHRCVFGSSSSHRFSLFMVLLGLKENLGTWIGNISELFIWPSFFNNCNLFWGRKFIEENNEGSSFSWGKTFATFSLFIRLQLRNEDANRRNVKTDFPPSLTHRDRSLLLVHTGQMCVWM